MINFEAVKSEKALRTMIQKNLKKEYHPATKPSVDFIYKILDDAYNSGLVYDVTDLRPKVLAFAVGSTNHSSECVKLVQKMKFASEKESIPVDSEEPIVFFDVEVFPNLFLVNWKVKGIGNPVYRMVNPQPQDIEELLKYRLIGFNNRRYDNHMLYARYLGHTTKQLFDLSYKIIHDHAGFFRDAYGISYSDVYDFASAAHKKSLKKWEIELGIDHLELGLPWDQDVPEDQWERVSKYCDNDVIATEKVFDHLKSDWITRQILAKLSGLSLNDTTNQHAIKIIFGDNKKPQSQFVYTDLSTIFPGYRFEKGRSFYKDEDPGEGGYVYSKPGLYGNVALLDVASMHPTSIRELNLFGPYTARFNEIVDTRLSIKHNDLEAVRKALDGSLVEFLDLVDKGEITNKDLANALKTVINSIYGLTSASFDNPCRDPRNVDNIVAKRGALFMIDLKHAVQEKGFTVAHIKTDSIKIPDATPEIIQFVIDFGKKYGYTFEHEATYDKMCLVDDANYIAKYKDGGWTATGSKFKHPYIFKTLFSKEKIGFSDLCETKHSSVGYMYLDTNEGLEEDSHVYTFIGKDGSFCPIKPGCGGGLLVREKNGKYDAVGGTKGYRWKESEVVRDLDLENIIDYSYFNALVDSAVDEISKYGDFEFFASDITYDEHPWFSEIDPNDIPF